MTGCGVLAVHEYALQSAGTQNSKSPPLPSRIQGSAATSARAASVDGAAGHRTYVTAVTGPPSKTKLLGLGPSGTEWNELEWNGDWKRVE